jgi:DNA-binding response OmpR family regulator
MKGYILFADNDERFIKTRSEFLKDSGYEVVSACTLAEAEQILRDKWIHVAIIDLRMTDDNDDADISGLTLAKQQAFRHVPKIILTGFPTFEYVREALGPEIDGLPPAVDFLAKKEGPDALIQAVEQAFHKYVRINQALGIQTNEHAPVHFLHLVSLIDQKLDHRLLVNRSRELEDIFRRLFYKKDQIRMDRLLWQRDGRVALVVFAFKEGLKPESIVVVCGQNAIINEEARHFEEFAPKTPGNTGTTLVEKMKAETTHFAANAYILANHDLENVQTLAELYRLGAEKTFDAILNRFYQETLLAWHQEKLIREKGSTLDLLYRQRLRLAGDLPERYFEERIGAIEAQCATIGARLERKEGILDVRFNGRSFTYRDPIPLLTHAARATQPVLQIAVPGALSGENILTNESGHIWLTDFAEAGLAPLLWNYVSLEAVIRFDWLETKELQRRHELEQCLVFTDFARPDIRDLEPSVRKSARAIQVLRKLAVRAMGSDPSDYHYGMFFQAARRLADFDASSPLTSIEVARLGQIVLALAMIAARISQGGADLPAAISTGSTELQIADETARILLVGHRKVSLSSQPFAVFHYLFRNADRVCTKEQIIRDVLKNEYKEDYLYTLIGRIRTAIEESPEHPRYLLTEPNAGYRLITRPE